MNGRSQSRESLLAQLEIVFRSRGYEGATLAQLAEATGLGKASLYHHFPGGKTEMAAVLLRDAVVRLERMAFSKLSGSRRAEERIKRFINGFNDYTHGGERSCLIAVFAQGSMSEQHGAMIAEQYRDWTRRLALVIEDTGVKPKKPDRTSHQMLALLYGHQLSATLLNDPAQIRRGIKRIRKSLPD